MADKTPVQYIKCTVEQYNSLKSGETVSNHTFNEMAYYYVVDTNNNTAKLYIGTMLLSNVDGSSTDITGGHNFYEGGELPKGEALGSQYKENDVYIKIEYIKDDDGNDTSTAYRTAYYLDKDNNNNYAWKAMAGNYNASNVYFDKDILITSSVGNISATDAKPGTLEFKNRNLESIWQYLYAKEDKDIAVTQPSISLRAGSNISGEFGSYFDNKTVTCTFTDGTYEHGSKDSAGNKQSDNKAGVRWTNAVSIDQMTNNTSSATKIGNSLATNALTNGVYPTSFSGTFSNFTENQTTITNSEGGTETKNQIQNNKTYYFKTTGANWDASAFKPITNFGYWLTANKGEHTDDFDSAWGNTTEKTNQTASAYFSVSGWRGWFSGYVKVNDRWDYDTIDSEAIRSLMSDTPENGTFFKKQSSSSYTEINVPSGTNQIIFAAPSGAINYTLKSGTNVLASGFELLEASSNAAWDVNLLAEKDASGNYVSKKIPVNGKNNFTAVDYEVFYAEVNAGSSQSGKYKFKFSKKA